MGTGSARKRVGKVVGRRMGKRLTLQTIKDRLFAVSRIGLKVLLRGTFRKKSSNTPQSFSKVSLQVAS